ncbi:dual specificity protein phosphatase family protein [Thiorhodococcus minor]|uniref:Dual specificity protein phosphatase family protein n=1 Tax=Thiorhodococcus minor TaxID=57489 RepID=A0A6M0K2F8_9GAMM|nr:dual specificity protein phosphatase [Thiorhodococcus minor]NEV63926.1 dual specificity protein phosphatase family protein [Thiorhodococcus minor]
MAIDFITDQVAVGAREDALSADALAEAGIDFVLSLVLDMETPGVRQVRLEVRDREPLSTWTMARAVELIAAEVDAGRRVLVHCHMGLSRSPAIVLCYLRERCGMTMRDALRALKQARPQSMPHPALLASIIGYYDGAPSDLQPAPGRAASAREGMAP